ncbi:GIY-YIG nuclease family protein [Endozoicomonas sp. ALE010]|uniref:GIY-YIG nuclease family protein n=1 Tax=Endozoicomonas sp. ALE010 TaxID=3403081 RepID=UPI003BB70DD0
MERRFHQYSSKENTKTTMVKNRKTYKSQPKKITYMSWCIYIYKKKQARRPISSRQLYPLVVYIGKTNNLNTRLESYLLDKRESIKASATRKIRENIKTMFSEYGDSLEIFLAAVPPDNLTTVEDTLIQLFDPIFNSSQRLSKDDFNNYSNYISASFDEPYDAYIENEPDYSAQKAFSQNSFLLCNPEPAF